MDFGGATDGTGGARDGTITLCLLLPRAPLEAAGTLPRW